MRVYICSPVTVTLERAPLPKSPSVMVAIDAEAGGGNRISVGSDGERQRLWLCCSVLQCVAVYCSVLQCVAVRCSALMLVTVMASVSDCECVAVCCSVLQCVAARCSVLMFVTIMASVSNRDCVAVCCSVLQFAAARCSVLMLVTMMASVSDCDCVAVCRSVLPCVAVRCSVLQCVVVCYSALQCGAVRCSVLQCVAVRYRDGEHQRPCSSCKPPVEQANNKKNFAKNKWIPQKCCHLQRETHSEQEKLYFKCNGHNLSYLYWLNWIFATRFVFVSFDFDCSCILHECNKIPEKEEWNHVCDKTRS